MIVHLCQKRLGKHHVIREGRNENMNFRLKQSEWFVCFTFEEYKPRSINVLAP